MMEKTTQRQFRTSSDGEVWCVEFDEKGEMIGVTYSLYYNEFEQASQGQGDWIRDPDFIERVKRETRPFELDWESQHKMNSEVKAKWVEALRGGQYAQGRGQLKEGAAYCCLGVLCDVITPNRWDEEDYYVDESGNRYSSYLPNPLMEEIGLSTDTATRLASLNDYKAPFEYIASIIEKYL
jgi:hypothetical protein